MEEIMVMTDKQKYLNKDLNSATAQIRKVGTKIKEGLFEIAHIIAKVEAEQSYVMDGFKSVHEWTELEFGIKQSRSYALLSIGKEWTREKLNSKGQIIGYTSAIGLDSGYNTTQVEKMLPGGKELAQELDKDGIITPSMSAAEIGRIIKNHTSPEVTETEEELEEETSTEVEDAPTPEICIRVTDEDGYFYDVPESILKKYFVEE